jgi:two-component system, OmpR family, sensor histidine kinase KdpD
MKDTFLTAVSHELRTPLTAVLGFAQTLEADGERLSAAQRTAISGRIAVSALRLEKLLSDLLDLDRLRRGIIEPRRRPVNLAVLVGRMLEGAEVASRRNVHLTADPAVLNVDAAMIERVVENLLANVDRYTPEDTDVWVKVCRTEEGAVIEVADAGPGVPEELRSHIFEPFEQGADAIAHSPGVGIGLSLVSRFAEAHGGRAEVTERPGGGAVFRIHLPAVEAPDADELSVSSRRRVRREAS